jgi:hypothetical protein
MGGVRETEAMGALWKDNLRRMKVGEEVLIPALKTRQAHQVDGVGTGNLGGGCKTTAVVEWHCPVVGSVDNKQGARKKTHPDTNKCEHTVVQ